ncbi:hypothetical protein JOC78_001011 [Bacillus ectoiniformans]|nr:hypothetical protein [Bacillus ectoiniformans]
MKKMIKQRMEKYEYEPGWLEEEEIYEELCEKVQKRLALDDEDVYEIIEDEVYAFMI